MLHPGRIPRVRLLSRKLMVISAGVVTGMADVTRGDSINLSTRSRREWLRSISIRGLYESVL